MYYKIINKECGLYKELHDLRTNELAIENKNIELIEERVGQKFTTFLGHRGQQNFLRVTQYQGFKFEDNSKLDTKVWTQHKEYEEIVVPNKRTKSGREMLAFLKNELGHSWFRKVFKILDVEVNGKFRFPFVDIVGEIILLYVGDDLDLKDENLIEITKKEFNQLRELL